MVVVAIIPARAGSKRVKNKNIRPFCGKPLIEYTIIQAIESKYINRIVITTDIPDVQHIVDKYKDKKKIDIDWRPAHLCGDDASSQSFINHLMEKRLCGDINILLQTTSPLREVSFIDKCIELYILNKFDSFMAVMEIVKWVYYPNGIIYIFKDKLYTENMFLYLMSKKDSIDINTEEEFSYAEKCYREREQK